MTGKLTTTKKVAGVVGVCAVVLAGVACTSTIDGDPTFVGGGATTTSETTTSQTTTQSTTTQSTTSQTTTTTSQTTTTNGDDNTPAAAPDQPYMYEDGTSVKLDEPIVDDEMSGLLSSEYGRILPFHVENKSQWDLDLSSTAAFADVDCEGSSQWVFPNEPIGGPELLPVGESASYALYVGFRKADVGKTCLIEIPFEAVGASGTDVATFTMVIN